MFHYIRLIICIFLLSSTAVYALPPIDEVIEKLGVGKNVKWALDPERTSAHLGGNSDNDCRESFVFVSQKEVDVFLSCSKRQNNSSAKTTKSWSVQRDDKKHNNTITFDNKYTYEILFTRDGKYMKLSSTPGERSEYMVDRIYKRS